MAAAEKVYVCGRCGDFGAPDIEELVSHMTNCRVPVLRKKDEGNHSEENELIFEDSDNSEGGIEYVNISEEKESSQMKKIPHVTVIADHYRNNTIEASESPLSPFIWSRKTALILLNLLKSHKDDLESPYIRRKAVWQKIAIEMQQKYGYSVSDSQCENKFKNMSNRYRKAKENNMHSDGRTKQTCFLYNELDDYFRSDARYQPRRDSMYDSNTKSPKIIRPTKYVDSDVECIEKESINISESESSPNCKNSSENEKEPIWVKKMMETYERCHRENMKMQREFIDVLKQILDKK